MTAVVLGGVEWCPQCGQEPANPDDTCRWCATCTAGHAREEPNR